MEITQKLFNIFLKRGLDYSKIHIRLGEISFYVCLIFKAHALYYRSQHETSFNNKKIVKNNV